MGYQRKECYTLETVFGLIGQEDRELDGDSIHMDSLRYQVFQRQPACAKCGLKGFFFAKERQINWKGQLTSGERYHLNMYGMNELGEEVLFTKDHIHPKSKGGSNGIKNMQTMCWVCNKEKADKLEEVGQPVKE